MFLRFPTCIRQAKPTYLHTGFAVFAKPRNRYNWFLLEILIALLGNIEKRHLRILKMDVAPWDKHCSSGVRWYWMVLDGIGWN